MVAAMYPQRLRNPLTGGLFLAEGFPCLKLRSGYAIGFRIPFATVVLAGQLRIVS